MTTAAKAAKPAPRKAAPRKAAPRKAAKPAPRKAAPAKAPARGEQAITWLEAHCRVPEGKMVGQPVKLRPWQRDIIRGIYDTPTRRAIISFGRKNGKTALSAMLLLLHLCGPEARPNSQLYSAAQSREQAAILFALAAKMIRLSADLSAVVTIRDTAKQIACPELGTLYRALSAEASTAYGLSPVFAVHDELGQVKGPRSELYEAIETASAAHDDPLSICISTQAPTDADLFSVLIDDAKTGGDPRTKIFLYTADETLDPFSDEALIAANPAFGDFQNPVEVRAMASDAQRMPTREAEYRNLILNQRVESVSPFVSRSVWESNGGETVTGFAGLRVWAGLDLSETSDLTALVLVAQVGDHWHVKPVFWLPADGLIEKSAKDRVPYDVWQKNGMLETTPGRAIEYSYVARRLFEMFATMDVQAVGFDRYNMRHLQPWLRTAGFGEAALERFVEVGQGFIGMGPAVRELEAQLLNGHIRHGMHPVLSMCAANAVSESDPAGNRKLSKKRSRGRIDGMVALAMAVGVAVTAQATETTSIWNRANLWT
jgi:phage terminase large subunit-like protein